MEFLVYYLVGSAAGAINTIASGGTALALPILMVLGIPPHIANASNRLGLLVSGVTRVAVFHRAGKIDWSYARKVAPPMAFGALVGALIEHEIPEEPMKWVIFSALVMVLALVLMGRKRFMEKRAPKTPDFSPARLGVFFLIGIWAGFLAIESGGMALWALVVLVGIETIAANALKSVLTLVTSLVSVLVMGIEHQIYWGLGITFGAGSMLGSWLAARFAVTEKARFWIFRMLIVMLVAEIVWTLFSSLLRTNSVV